MKPHDEVSAPRLGLAPEQFAAAFPFHFALDRGFRFFQVGSSLARICPDIRAGVAVGEVLRRVETEGSITRDWVLENMSRFFLLEHPASGLQLRGQFVPAADGALLFLGSPWFTDTSQINAFGLRFKDFAIHDPVVDLLLVLQASKAAVADGQKLAKKLTEQRAELQSANERLRAQQDELRKLALVAARTTNAVILTDEKGRVVWVNEGFQRVTGYTFEDVRGRKPGEVLQGPGTDAETVRRIGKHLRKGEGFSESILNYHKNGSAYWVSFEVQPIHDSEGRLTNFMAIQTDITARRAAQQRLTIQFEVSRVLAEATGYDEVFARLLEAVCESLGWQVGQLWRVSEGSLRLARSWHLPGEDLSGFLAGSEAAEFGPGVGLPGRVWESGRSAWIPDLMKDGNFPRAAAAAASGLRAAFAFPVIVRGAAWGVFEFFSRKIEEPDEAMLRTFNAVGQQVGQFIVRKQAEDALQATNMLQQAILDGASYAIISTSTDGTIQTCNHATERMLGYSASELVGRATPAVFHDPEEVAARAAELSRELGRAVEPGFEAFVARAKLGTPDEREWTYIRKDGGRFPVHLTVTALIDAAGCVSGYLGVASDITDRKRAARELVDAKDAAEAANRAKSEFLATISHEIRTPLNGIIGLADILAMSPLDEEQGTQLRLLIGSAQSLLALINDLLDFSKIEAGRLEIEERDFDPAAELGGIVETFRPLAESKALALEATFENLPPALRGDSLRLRQVLSNLLSNAIKFTPSGRVAVDARADREGGGWRLRMAVSDTGIGIGEEAMKRIFEPFTQADASVSRKFGGTGLGLAICRRLARAMDGDITAETSPAGSVFRAHMLLGEASSATLQPQSAGTGHIPDLAILVVDDNEVNRMVATTMLRKIGQTAASARSGAEAVELAAAGAFDLIFMDMQMPGMDGVEATARIRQLPLEKRPRIVALTANAYDTDRLRCMEAGMDGFVSKPIRLEDLRGELCKVCGHASSCAEAGQQNR